MDSSRLEEIVTFLCQYQWIYKHSNTKFIKAGVLEAFPANWMESLMKLSFDDLNNIPFGRIPESLDPNLKDFLKRISELSITVPSVEYLDSAPSKMRGINPKKLQEISSLSRQIHKICVERNIRYLVDLGCGLGYLCQMLYEKFNYKILGIECEAERVETARQRQEKFFPTSRDSVKFVSHFVSPSSWEFIADELVRAFGVDLKVERFALVGLHACGDLTVTSIRIFLATEAVLAAIVMPCCYHKMAICPVGGKPVNFPLSRRLMDSMKRIPGGDEVACRPFLRLACQQPASRWKRMTEEEHKIHGKNMFRRALLDALVEKDEDVERVKKSERVTGDFDGAVCGFEIREVATNATIPWNNEHRSKWRSLWEKYPNGGELAEHLTLLQTTIQEMCENLILLDRKLFVEEISRNFQCEAVKILDADTSPRCIVLISTKK